VRVEATSKAINKSGSGRYELETHKTENFICSASETVDIDASESKRLCV
jgi:hypothetical protein